MYGKDPYLSHLFDVLLNVMNYNLIAQELALFHDLFEDTECTEEEMSKEFGTVMTRLVRLTSDEPGVNRKLRKEATNKKLAAIDDEDDIEVYALIVKAADRLANMLKCAINGNHGLMKMYIKEYPEFKKAVYRTHICPEIWNRIFAIYDQYK